LLLFFFFFFIFFFFFLLLSSSCHKLRMSFVPAEAKEVKEERKKARGAYLEEKEEFYRRKMDEKKQKELSGEVSRFFPPNPNLPGMGNEGYRAERERERWRPALDSDCHDRIIMKSMECKVESGSLIFPLDSV